MYFSIYTEMSITRSIYVVFADAISPWIRLLNTCTDLQSSTNQIKLSNTRFKRRIKKNSLPQILPKYYTKTDDV